MSTAVIDGATTWADFAKSLIAGGAAGGMYVILSTLFQIRTDPLCSCLSSRTAVAPLERLKIVLQVQGNEKVYTGVWQVRKRLF